MDEKKSVRGEKLEAEIHSKWLCSGRFTTSQAKVEGSSLPPRVNLHFCAVVSLKVCKTELMYFQRVEEQRQVADRGWQRQAQSLRSACTRCSKISSLCTDHFQPYSFLLPPYRSRNHSKSAEVGFYSQAALGKLYRQCSKRLCNGHIFCLLIPSAGLSTHW